MKKIIFVLLTILLITGCSYKNNDCYSKGDTGTGIIITQEYSFKSSGNNLSSVKIVKTYKFDKKEDFKSFKSIVDNDINQSNKNVKKDLKTGIKSYTVTTNISNIKTFSKEDLEKYGIKSSAKDMKQLLKNQGLTCR